MSILLQLLLLAVGLASLYASYIHNKDKYEEVLAILPDFKKLFKESRPSPYVKVSVCVPDFHAETVRTALAEAGAGASGHYTFQSFSSQGHGRYKPGPGANPVTGTEGQLEIIEQE